MTYDPTAAARCIRDLLASYDAPEAAAKTPAPVIPPRPVASIPASHVTHSAARPDPAAEAEALAMAIAAHNPASRLKRAVEPQAAPQSEADRLADEIAAFIPTRA